MGASSKPEEMVMGSIFWIFSYFIFLVSNFWIWTDGNICLIWFSSHKHYLHLLSVEENLILSLFLLSSTNIKDLQVACHKYDIFLSFETLVFNRHNIVEISLPRFNNLILFQTDSRPLICGLAIYIRSGVYYDNQKGKCMYLSWIPGHQSLQ